MRPLRFKGLAFDADPTSYPADGAHERGSRKPVDPNSPEAMAAALRQLQETLERMERAGDSDTPSAGIETLQAKIEELRSSAPASQDSSGPDILTRLLEMLLARVTG